MNVTIMGAGLAGLATAYRLTQAGIDVQVLEAQAFAGGRIQSAIKGGHQDLGPTWVWPYAQPVITQWLDELGLETFDQFDTGADLLDRDANESAQQHSLPSQYGSTRIKGGTHALVDALQSKLDDIVRFEHIVKNCTVKNDQWQLIVSTLTTEDKLLELKTDQLVIAIPPRLAAAVLSGIGAERLDELNHTLQLLHATPTWMAPHAKVVIEFEAAFWREQGLSGRVASQVGPLAEIHDHCGPDGTPAALFGFAGIPAQSRRDNADQFIAAIKEQLKRCFGQCAPEPLKIYIKDWAFEPYTSTLFDRNGAGAHPEVLPDRVREQQHPGRLWFAVAETASRSPGLIEGALARADEVAKAIVMAQS